MKNRNLRLNTSNLFNKILYLLAILTISVTFAAATAPSGKFDVEDARELIKQAEKLIRKGQLSEAEKILRRAVAQYPKDSPAKLALSYLLLKQKKLVEAFNLALPVVKADPKNSFAFAILGMVYLNAGSFKDAEKLLINSVALNRREALGWFGLGMLDFYENRITKSLINLNAAVTYDDDEPDFVYALAQVAARGEKYAESAKVYRRFLRISPDNDTERRERIKGLISFLNFLGERRSTYNLEGKDNTIVPIDLTNDRPVIEVRVNGKDEPLRFVLDTGAGMTVISNKTAEKLKIQPVSKGGVARALGGDGKFDIVYGFLRTIEVGDVKIKNIPVYIREFHNTRDKIDGYIGLSLISKFRTTIDYGNLTFSLEKKKKNADRKVADESLKLPLRLTSSGFLSGEVQLEGVDKPLNFIVDTGANISVISDEVADMENIRKFENEKKTRIIGAAGITDEVSSFLLPKVTFGTHSRENLMAVALNMNVINETSGFAQAGILGGNFLKNYRVTFDFERSEVTFVVND